MLSPSERALQFCSREKPISVPVQHSVLCALPVQLLGLQLPVPPLLEDPPLGVRFNPSILISLHVSFSNISTTKVTLGCWELIKK